MLSMDIFTSTVGLSVLAVSCSALFFSGPDWNGFQVTWGPNPFNSNYFADLPRTLEEADAEGFVKISDCDVTAPWRGSRYVKDGDYSVTLLFDVNGYIAGIQSSVSSGQTFPPRLQKPPFVLDGDRYVISAYFGDPGTICTRGRTEREFESEGTGNNLYIQNNTVPELSVLVPIDESDLGTTRWTEGKCFWTMGNHYWYNMRQDMSCDEFFPVFLLYNSGKLNAFGWAFNTNLDSPRFEHPSHDVFHKFMDPVPSCISSIGAVSTMHIYLTSNTLWNRC